MHTHVHCYIYFSVLQLAGGCLEKFFFVISHVLAFSRRLSDLEVIVLRDEQELNDRSI